MALYQCTDCGNVKHGSKWVTGSSIYAGGCENDCGFVYHMRLSKLQWLNYKIRGVEPSLSSQKRKSGNAHDPLYGWNHDHK